MDTATVCNHYIMKKAKKKAADLLIDGFWSEYRDLNPRPLGPEPSALPAALYPVMPKLTWIVYRESRCLSRQKSGFRRPETEKKYPEDFIFQ